VQSNVIMNPHLEGESFFWDNGPTGILLLHGFTATTAEVRPLAGALHAAGYTVAGPLLPGHGTTPEEMNRCRWQDWAGAAETAYQELAARCERVLVGGESMGGLLALFLGSEHPEIGALLTYAPALKIRSRIAPLLAPLLAPFITSRAKRQQPPRPSDARWQGYQVEPVSAAAQIFRLQRQVQRRLSRIQQPLLILQGRQDQTVHPQAPDMILQAVRSTLKELHWLDQSGHCVILDGEWEQAAELTKAFIRKALDRGVEVDQTKRREP